MNTTITDAQAKIIGEQIGLQIAHALTDRTHMSLSSRFIDAIKLGFAEMALTEMDAFELRWQLVYGLHPSDGLDVRVVDANELFIVGTDAIATRGLYLATGRQIHMWRVTGLDSWIAKQTTGHWLGGERFINMIADLDTDLAWVRQRG